MYYVSFYLYYFMYRNKVFSNTEHTSDDLRSEPDPSAVGSWWRARETTPTTKSVAHIVDSTATTVLGAGLLALLAPSLILSVII